MLCVLLLILFLFFFGFVRALFSSTYCISSRSASPHTILSFRVIFGFFCLCCVAYQFRFSIRLEMSFSLSFCFAFFFSEQFRETGEPHWSNNSNNNHIAAIAHTQNNTTHAKHAMVCCSNRSFHCADDAFVSLFYYIRSISVVATAVVLRAGYAVVVCTIALSISILLCVVVFFPRSFALTFGLSALRCGATSDDQTIFRYRRIQSHRVKLAIIDTDFHFVSGSH